MRYYSGIDLGARASQICLIDDQMTPLIQTKVPNRLIEVIGLLEPYKAALEIVVESTFNWDWLVDGRQEAGFHVCLAHTLGLSMITGAKVKTDRRDAFALAKFLKAGMIPQASIYPKATRPIRDLLRRRLHVVQLRAAEYGYLRNLLLRSGLLEPSRTDLTDIQDEDLHDWFEPPLTQLHGRQQLQRIALYTEQIKHLDAELVTTVADQAAYHRLLGVPGLGQTLALTVFYEVGDIQRFVDARHFCSSCRVVPGVAQSGNSTRPGRGRKQGSAYLKHALSQAAVHAVRCYPRIRRCFDRQLTRHRGRTSKLLAYNIIR